MERKITDKKELVKLVSFLAMCDGGLYKRKLAKNAQFVINHTNLEYLEYAKSILENITTVTINPRKDYNKDGYERKKQWRLETPQHPFFTKIQTRLYYGNYKSLDTLALQQLDAECLAILYMADGGIDYKGQAISSVRLHTKRLTEGDNRFLAFIIKQRLGIELTVNRHYQSTFLRVKGQSLCKFFTLVKPYILSSFAYKVPNDELLAKYRQDDDIVCTLEKSKELGRNDQALVTN